jgi:two-component system, OmpR family, sensor kinase
MKRSGRRRGGLALWLYGTSVVQLVILAIAVVAVGFLVGGPPHDHDHEHGPPPPGPRLDAPGPPDGRPPPPRHEPPGLTGPLVTFFGFGLVIVAIGAIVTSRRIQRMLRAEKELLANVSHELRTPLARIRVALDLASEGDAEAARASLTEIAVDLGELETLLDDVLTSTRLELAGAGPPDAGLPMHPEEIAPEEIVTKAVERFRAAQPKRELVVTVAAGLPKVAVDPMLMRRVLDNLLQNAHKYTPDLAAPIQVIASADATGVELAVEDRGQGIAPEDLEHVFTPFFRADRSRSRGTGGVGLGLTLAKRIVVAHHGTIGISSVPGTGTKVRVHLPKAPTS